MHIHRGGRFALALAVFGLLAVGTAAQAQLVFDFEDQAATANVNTSNFPGALNSLTMTKNGFSLTIQRTGGAGFDVADFSSLDPSLQAPGFGNRALSPFNAPTTDDYFVATFSKPVFFFSIDMGDYGGDVDLLELIGTDTTGATLSVTDTLPLPPLGTVFSSTTLTLSGANPLTSVRFRGGSTTFPNSVYYDNLTLQPIPELPAPVLAGLAALPLGLLLRRRGK